MVPDTTGAAPGTTKVYTFVASKPGTFLYEAGLLPRAQHQVAMGLYGALVVRPTRHAASGRPTADASTAFNNEQVLVLSEIDPALNASPSTFDMRDFKPAYFLINGTVYPDTPLIGDETQRHQPGNKVLLRYVNAGAKHHSMAMLGRAADGDRRGRQPAAVPAHAGGQDDRPGADGRRDRHRSGLGAPGSKFAVYDGNLMLHNAGVDNAFGGMMTFVKVAGTPPTTDTTGPVTSACSMCRAR